MKKGLRGYYLSTECMFFDGKVLWFAEFDRNEIYYYDLEQDEAVLFCNIDQEDTNGQRLFGTFTLVGSWLYCVPFAAASMYKVNIETKEIIQIRISEPESGMYSSYVSTAKFMSVVKFENSIFMIGTSYPAIVQYNIDTEEVTYHNDWFAELQKYFKTDDNAIFRKVFVQENKIIAPCCKGNAVLEFDMKNYNHHVYCVGGKGDSYAAICFAGNDYWLAPRKKQKIVRWNKEDNCITYLEYPDGFKENNYCFTEMKQMDEKNIVVFAGNTNMSLVIDLETGTLKEWKHQLRNIKNLNIATGVIENGKIYAFAEGENALVKISQDEVSFVHILAPKEVQLNKNENRMLIENRTESITELLECLKGIEEEDGINTKKEIIGTQIWKILL